MHIFIYACVCADVRRVDMRAVYLQSIRSPHQQRQRRHMPASRWHGDIISQLSRDSDVDDDYVNDSFCVDADADDTHGNCCCHVRVGCQTEGFGRVRVLNNLELSEFHSCL